MRHQSNKFRFDPLMENGCSSLPRKVYAGGGEVITACERYVCSMCVARFACRPVCVQCSECVVQCASSAIVRVAVHAIVRAVQYA